MTLEQDLRAVAPADFPRYRVPRCPRCAACGFNLSDRRLRYGGPICRVNAGRGRVGDRDAVRELQADHADTAVHEAAHVVVVRNWARTDLGRSTPLPKAMEVKKP